MEGRDGRLPQERREGEGVAGEAPMPEMPTEFGGKFSLRLSQRRFEFMVMKVELKISL
jgi:hypothetical protein